MKNDESQSENTSSKSLTHDELVCLIKNELSEVLEVGPDQLDQNTQFDQFGLDSLAAVDLIGALSKHLSRDLDPTLPYLYTNINLLASHLLESEYI